MSKKESNSELEGSESVKTSETIVSDEQFDLSVLKSDINKHERELKDAVNQKLIDQANFQQGSENIQQEKEKIESFEEALSELLEFCFSFINRPLEKVDVSKFDSSFINELVEKIMKLIPKEQMDEVQKFIGIGNKSNSAIQMLKLGKFIMFLSKELFKRYDEYTLHRKTHEKPPLSFKILKKDKPEA